MVTPAASLAHVSAKGLLTQRVAGSLVGLFAFGEAGATGTANNTTALAVELCVATACVVGGRVGLVAWVWEGLMRDQHLLFSVALHNDSNHNHGNQNNNNQKCNFHLILMATSQFIKHKFVVAIRLHLIRL